MATFIEGVVDNISVLSAAINDNEFIVSARAAVTTNLLNTGITPSEQATIYAAFEKDFSSAIMNKIIDTAAQAQVLASEIAVKVAQEEMLLQQSQTETQNTAKAKYEVEQLLPVQKAEEEAKTGLYNAQIDSVIAKQLNENALTVKEELLKTAQTANADMQTELISGQILTEPYKRIDISAGINIKNEQAKQAREAVKFDEARRRVLLRSVTDNNAIKKAEVAAAQLNAMASDTTLVISPEHIAYVNGKIDGIDGSSMSDSTIYSGAPVVIATVPAV